MELGGVTSDIVSLALDTAMQQHRAIAQNLANANSQGYNRVYVDFDEVFGSLATAHADKASVKLAAKRLDSGFATHTGEGVRIEEEMAALAENTLYYQALLRGLSTRGSALKMAIGEGK
jgi:flagellar basal-body rod protein FlgB